MSTSNLIARYERLPLHTLNFTNAQKPSVVIAQQSVNADRDRIFQVLTVSEYVDAWFSAPGSIARSTEISSGPDCFLVSYRLQDGREERFVGYYKVLRRSKIYFTWSRDGYEAESSSLVKIRLRGDFGRTTVHVTHLGLDESEHSHYSLLWEASLGRLASLF